MDHRTKDMLLRQNPQIDAETLAQSMALSEALRHNGLKRRTYSLQRPDRIHRVHPLDESSSVRRHRP
jgi:hypothetical protein